MSFQERVLETATGAYERVLARLNNGIAAGENPALIVQPRNHDELQEALDLALQQGLQISVCSGSHSALCSLSRTLMLDLSAGLNKITCHGDLVTVQAGASMGALLEMLTPLGRMLPVGTSLTPGFGLLTMGGIGHLSRSLGLTVDHIEAIRGITANGQSLEIKADHSDQELWMMLRGASVFLAVITEVTLKTDTRSKLHVIRHLCPIVQLQELINNAESLPEQESCSMILGFCSDQTKAQILTYAVAAIENQPTLLEFQRKPGGWSEIVAGQEELPEFEFPSHGGVVPPLEAPNPNRHQRIKTQVYSISVPRGVGQSISEVLTDLISSAPNRQCRIDLQHVGGVVNAVDLDRTAYRGRQAEWSIVVTAVFGPNDPSAAKSAIQWAEDCFAALAQLANHYYIVQRHPESPTYHLELELAYGPILSALRRRQQSFDPHGMLAPMPS